MSSEEPIYIKAPLYHRGFSLTIYWPSSSITTGWPNLKNKYYIDYAVATYFCNSQLRIKKRKKEK